MLFQWIVISTPSFNHFKSVMMELFELLMINAVNDIALHVATLMHACIH